MTIAHDVDALIGSTPLIDLSSLCAGRARILALVGLVSTGVG